MRLSADKQEPSANHLPRRFAEQPLRQSLTVDRLAVFDSADQSETNGKKALVSLRE